MAFIFPPNPTTGEELTGPFGEVYTWDSAKWTLTAGGAGAGGSSVTISDTAPLAPTAGALWWNSLIGQLFIWYTDPTSSQWVMANSLVGATGGASIVVSDTPPASPAAGQLWFDSANVILYVFYNDGSSSQWVVANNQNSLPDAPNDGRLYGRQSAGWQQVAPAATLNNVGRNLVMNPVFTVAQRGAGPWTTAGAYTVDRWALALSGDTNTISQTAQNDTGRAQIGDEASTFVLQSIFTGSAAAGSYSAIRQSMEGVRRLAGKTVTVSFWAWSSPTALKVGINLVQNFGTGGSPSAAAWAQATGSSVTLTSSAVRYSVTISIPSVAGKTLGTNGDDFTGLWLWYSSGATNNAFAGNIGVQNGSVWLWGVQLEVGSVATPLDYGGTPADQLRQCQRFYQAIDTGAMLYNTAGVTSGQTISYAVTMRAVPTAAMGNVTISNGTAVTAACTPRSAMLYWTTTATGNAQLGGYAYLSADL